MRSPTSKFSLPFSSLSFANHIVCITSYGLDPTPIPGITAKAGGKLKRLRGKRSGNNYAESEDEEDDEDKEEDEDNDDEVDEVKEKPKSGPEPVLRRGTRSRPATKKR